MLAGAAGSAEGGSALRLIHVVVGQVWAETPCHLGFFMSYLCAAWREEVLPGPVCRGYSGREYPR